MQEMQKKWVRFLGQEDSLEEGIAIHSSILAWNIPRTEEPGRLQSIGLQRAGPNWACVHTCIDVSMHTYIDLTTLEDLETMTSAQKPTVSRARVSSLQASCDTSLHL